MQIRFHLTQNLQHFIIFHEKETPNLHKYVCKQIFMHKPETSIDFFYQNKQETYERCTYNFFHIFAYIRFEKKKEKIFHKTQWHHRIYTFMTEIWHANIINYHLHAFMSAILFFFVKCIRIHTLCNQCQFCKMKINILMSHFF